MGLQQTLDQFKTAAELGEFLKTTPEAVDASTTYRPLIHYCQKGDSACEFVRKLLEFGANPNLTNTKGTTPLQLASISGHELVCAVLIEAGADVDVISAAALGKVNVLQAASIESTASLQDLNSATGCTPLQAAVFRNQGDVIDYLLQSGADSTIQDDEGHDSVWLAEQLGNTRLLEQLKSNSHSNLTTTVEAALTQALEPAPAANPSGYKPF